MRLTGCGAVVCVGIVLVQGVALAGPLTPPGAPAPTMKTLVEIEPRIAINATNTPAGALSEFEITAPGSYYLTGDVTIDPTRSSGVRILAESVTIDLNGYTIYGHATADAGITVSVASQSLVIRNGTIRSFPETNVGMGIDTSFADDVLIQDIRVIDADETGIKTGQRTIIERCQVSGSDTGFMIGPFNTVKDCSVTNGDEIDFYATGGAPQLVRCVSVGSQGNSFEFAFGGSAIECTVYNNIGGFGFFSEGDTTLLDCTVTGTGINGITVGSGNAVIRNCRISDTGNWGITTSGFGSNSVVIENCVLENINGTGISVAGGKAARITGCVINGPAGNGISSGHPGTLVQDCVVESAGDIGIFLQQGGSVRDCLVYSSNNEGIYVLNDTTVQNCEVISPGGHGIWLGDNCSAIQNVVREPLGGLSSTNFGIYAVGDGVLIDENHVSLRVFAFQAGIRSGPGDNVTIVRNVLAGCAIDTSGFGSGFINGPLNDLTSPWANFER